MRLHTLAISDRKVVTVLTSNEIYAAMAIELEKYGEANPENDRIASMVMDDMLGCPVWAGDPVDVASNWGDRLYAHSTGNDMDDAISYARRLPEHLRKYRKGYSEYAGEYEELCQRIISAIRKANSDPTEVIEYVWEQWLSIENLEGIIMNLGGRNEYTYEYDQVRKANLRGDYTKTYDEPLRPPYTVKIPARVYKEQALLAQGSPLVQMTEKVRREQEILRNEQAFLAKMHSGSNTQESGTAQPYQLAQPYQSQPVQLAQPCPTQTAQTVQPYPAQTVQTLQPYSTQTAKQYPASVGKLWDVCAVEGFALSFFVPLVGLVLSIAGITRCAKGKYSSMGFAVAGVVVSLLLLANNFSTPDGWLWW